jgi:hypothetical protein
MKRLPAVLLALCLNLGGPPTSAESISDLTPEASALEEVLGAKVLNDPTNDPKWRLSLAAALHRYCESILVQVPRNTPQEDRWVDDEYRDLLEGARAAVPGREQRLARIDNSVENARKWLRTVLSECSAKAKNLMEPKQASAATEALLWVRLSRFFSGADTLWRYFEIVGLVSQSGCRNLNAVTPADIFQGISPKVRDKNEICSWHYIHNSIVNHAVIPLLEVQ